MLPLFCTAVIWCRGGGGSGSGSGGTITLSFLFYKIMLCYVCYQQVNQIDCVATVQKGCVIGLVSLAFVLDLINDNHNQTCYISSCSTDLISLCTLIWAWNNFLHYIVDLILLHFTGGSVLSINPALGDVYTQNKRGRKKRTKTDGKAFLLFF